MLVQQGVDGIIDIFERRFRLQADFSCSCVALSILNNLERPALAAHKLALDASMSLTPLR